MTLSEKVFSRKNSTNAPKSSFPRVPPLHLTPSFIATPVASNLSTSASAHDLRKGTPTPCPMADTNSVAETAPEPAGSQANNSANMTPSPPGNPALVVFVEVTEYAVPAAELRELFVLPVSLAVALPLRDVLPLGVGPYSIGLPPGPSRDGQDSRPSAGGVRLPPMYCIFVSVGGIVRANCADARRTPRPPQCALPDTVRAPGVSGRGAVGAPTTVLGDAVTLVWTAGLSAADPACRKWVASSCRTRSGRPAPARARRNPSRLEAAPNLFPSTKRQNVSRDIPFSSYGCLLPPELEESVLRESLSWSSWVCSNLEL